MCLQKKDFSELLLDRCSEPERVNAAQIVRTQRRGTMAGQGQANKPSPPQLRTLSAVLHSEIDQEYRGEPVEGLLVDEEPSEQLPRESSNGADSDSDLDPRFLDLPLISNLDIFMAQRP